MTLRSFVICLNTATTVPTQALLFRHASRDSEDPLAEIGVFGYLRQCEQVPEYILEMRQAFFAQEDVWLVLEHAAAWTLMVADDKNRLGVIQ